MAMLVKLLQLLWTAFGGEIINWASTTYSNWLKQKADEHVATQNLAAQKEAAQKGDLDALANATDNLLNGSKPQ